MCTFCGRGVCLPGTDWASVLGLMARQGTAVTPPQCWVLSSEGWRRRTIVDTMPFFYWEVCEHSSAASTGVVCGAVATAY